MERYECQIGKYHLIVTDDYIEISVEDGSFIRFDASEEITLFGKNPPLPEAEYIPHIYGDPQKSSKTSPDRARSNKSKG